MEHTDSKTPAESRIPTAAARARRITRTSYVGIGANLLLAGFKAVVGLLSNSVAIVFDADYAD